MSMNLIYILGIASISDLFDKSKFFFAENYQTIPLRYTVLYKYVFLIAFMWMSRNFLSTCCEPKLANQNESASK